MFNKLRESHIRQYADAILRCVNEVYETTYTLKTPRVVFLRVIFLRHWNIPMKVF